MSEHIWIVRSPEGKAIGAGIVASGAIRDAQAHCGSTTYGIMQRMFGHVHSGTEDSYEQDGYTLTREPLTPPTPASAPRGEEVAWAWYDNGGIGCRVHFVDIPRDFQGVAFPLYAHPPAASGVSREMCEAFRRGVAESRGFYSTLDDEYVRAGMTAALTAAREVQP